MKVDDFDILDTLLGGDSVLAGNDDEGRTLLVQRSGRDVITTTTLQRNGWSLRRRYHRDGTYEESYGR